MNNSQRAKLDTCNRVKDCLTKFDSELAVISEFAVEKTAFIDALANINAAATVQSQTAAVAADAVRNAKENMATVTIKYAKRGRVKAMQLNNITLANHLDHPVTYILNAPKTLAVQRATEIKNQLNSNLVNLGNISSTQIDEITDAIYAFDTIKDHPVSNIQTRSATGTTPLQGAIESAFKHINHMNDLIDSYFTGINQPLVDEFELASQIISTGIHHTGVEGFITKDGNPVTNATVQIAGTNKMATTDVEGHYIIANVKAGDYTLEASHETGEKASKTAHISKGNFETVNIVF